MGLYIVANIDGNVISSTDGLVWSAPFNTGINIGKVAVGPNRIVYTGSDGDGTITTPYGLFHTPAWDEAPVIVPGTEGYYFNEVHYLGGKFIAMGYQIGMTRMPLFMYSSNGSDWTLGNLDPVYFEVIGGGNSIEFTDVGYNGVGYFIIGRKDVEGLAGGFYVTDITGFVGPDQWVDIESFPTDARQLVFAGEGQFLTWSAFSDDDKSWWATSNFDPSLPWFTSGFDMTEVLQYFTGLSDLIISEATIGVLVGPDGQDYVTWMVSTVEGQVIWWPHVPAGPFVSVPAPHTATLATVENLNPLRVTFSGENIVLDNERIRISGASGMPDLDGSYFAKAVGEGVYELYENFDLSTVVDGSSLSGSYVNSSATVELSRGTYIDALGYGDGKFFVGNDAEEVYMCSAAVLVGGVESFIDPQLVWQKVDDLNNSLVYWNDVDFGDFSCAPSVFTYDFSPDYPETLPNWRYGGEGNMDTAIVVEDGMRRSIQRTGYFDYLDGCGNRKVVEVRDGDAVTDAPSIPEATDNPTGHPTFGMNDVPSMTEQVIPTGNPLAN